MSLPHDQGDPRAAAAAVAELVIRSSMIAHAIEDQAQLLGCVERAMAKVSEVAEQVSGGVSHVAEVSLRANARAETGAVMLGGVVGDLERAVATAEACVDQLGELTARIEHVRSFADTIEQIARQTHLLALNAAIEAARAGEHGRGFAVVAEEVRRLAAGAAEATAQITATVREVGDASARSASSGGELRTSVESLRSGVDAAREATTAFAEISAGVEEVADGLSSLRERCGEQAQLARAALSDARVIGAATLSTRSATEALTHNTEVVAEATDALALSALDGLADAKTARALHQLVRQLRPLFDVPRTHAGALLALDAAHAARGEQLASGDLQALDRLLQESLRRFHGTLCGVTLTAAPGLLKDARLWMQWWVPGPRRLQPQLDPQHRGFYDYTQADWYRKPVGAHAEWLSDPYFDDGGAEAWIVTASVPVLSGGRVLAVATADLDLGAVDRLCGPALRSLGGAAALVSAAGVVVASTDRERLTVGKALSAELASWTRSVTEAHAYGPQGATLSRLSTLDWSLLALGRPEEPAPLRPHDQGMPILSIGQ